MRYCLACGLQRPNRYKADNCPKCGAYLKYLEGAAKGTAVKLHKAGLSVSYATAEVYSYSNGAIHTVNICIGLAKPYQAVVFRRLPGGYGYVLPHSYAVEYLSCIRTYGLIRYEVPYLDHKEARVTLKQKLKELDNWIAEATADGWLAICNLGGLL